MNGLDTACYYTFSTVSQTLAGAFGFLIAVVIYRIQRNDQELRARTQGAEAGRQFESTNDYRKAREMGDWTAIAAMLRKTPLHPNFEGSVTQADADRDKWLALAERQRLTARRLRSALSVTGTVIAVSLALIPLTPLLDRIGGRVAFPAMGADVSFAFYCLVLYYRLAKGVMD